MTYTSIKTVIFLDRSQVTFESIVKIKILRGFHNQKRRKGGEKWQLQKESKEHEMAPESGLGSSIVVCTLQLSNEKTNLANLSLPNGDSTAAFPKTLSQSQNLHNLHKTFIPCPSLFSQSSLPLFSSKA